VEVVELMLIYVVGSHFTGINFKWSILLTVAISIAWFVAYGVVGILTISNVFFFILFMIANLAQSYVFLKNEIEIYNNL